jgi:hypothetical protein
LTPLLAFAAAEAFPRLWARIRARAGTGRAEAMERIASFGVGLWVSGVLIMAFAVHPVVDRLTDPFERFRNAIYDHSADGSIVVMRGSDRRLVNPMYGNRRQVYFKDLTPEILDRLLASHGTITVVLHDRREHQLVRGPMLETLRQRALENQKILDVLTARPEFKLVFEGGEGVTSERLRIWRASGHTLDNGRHRSSSSIATSAGSYG